MAAAHPVSAKKRAHFVKPVVFRFGLCYNFKEKGMIYRYAPKIRIRQKEAPPMSQSHNFRSALNGFNREDVVRYIEYLNTKNTGLVNQLKSENQALKDELAELRARQAAAPAAQEGADPEKEALQAQVAQLQAELARIAAQGAAVPAREPAGSLAGEELEAYRRAERVERAAKERAEQIYLQATAVLSEATTQVDGAAEQFGLIVDRISAQIGELQTAVETGKNALADAAATMYAIRPETAQE